MSRNAVFGFRPHHHRHLPELIVAGGGGVFGEIEKPPLAHHQRAPIGSHGRLDHRKARLENPRVHQLAHRLVGSLLQRVPQVAGLGVGVLMLAQVGGDALAETLRAQVLLEHPEHRGALLVGQHVEHRARVLGAQHGELDRPRAAQRVDRHRRRARDREALPALPVRLPGVDREHLHEGGERLVEPDAVPPLHRDQIAEPHVGVLVRDDVGHALEFGARGAVFVDQQRGLAERDRAQVLHRARSEVGNRDQVELVARIGQLVIVGEPLERERADLARPCGQRPLARHVRDAQRGSGVGRLGRLELAHDEGEQVGRHLDRLLVDDLLFAAAEAALALDAGVGKGAQTFVDHQPHLEARLKRRLVPTRDRAARVGRLELRAGDQMRVALARPCRCCDRSRAACR